jgi:hypothetical protein
MHQQLRIQNELVKVAAGINATGSKKHHSSFDWFKKKIEN